MHHADAISGTRLAPRAVLHTRGFLLLLAALQSAGAGCTLVIGERPERELSGDGGADADQEDAEAASDAHDAGETPVDDAGGSQPDGAELDADAGEVRNDAGGADGGEAGQPEAGMDAGGALDSGNDVGADTGADSGTGPMEAGPIDSGGTPDAGLDCGATQTWYPDDDNDGFGRGAEARQACSKPAGRWSETGGDCNDDNDKVRPDQTQFFGDPYPNGTAQGSFDYDCKNGEEGDPGQAKLDESGCGGVLGLLCNDTTAYSPRVNRVGQGLNSLCGSTILIKCQMASLTACVAGSPQQTSTPYACR